MCKRMRRKELLAFEALLMGLIVEIGDSKFRLNEEYELCVACHHYDCKEREWEDWLKTDCSLQYFIKMCQARMTHDQFWELVVDIGLNKIDTKAL